MSKATLSKKLNGKSPKLNVTGKIARPELVGKITQRQLAELAGVSMTTIYNCLHAKELVNKRTLEHVHRIMEMYDYHPNSIAKAMVQGKSFSIGILVPKLDVSYFAKIASGIEQLFNTNGYNSIICQHLDDMIKEEREIRLMREKRVDGLIVRACGERTDSSIYRRLAEIGMPFVLIDREFDDLKEYFVGVDDYMATMKLTEYLIQKGHRRIGFIGWQRETSLRYKGYYDGLNKHGINVDDELYVECATEYNSGYDEAHILMNRTKDDRPTAIIAFNDCAAISAIEALWKMGFKIPEDVAIANIGGQENLRLSSLKLTSVILPLESIIREAVIMLNDQIDNKNWRKGPVRCSCRLSIGNSA